MSLHQRQQQQLPKPLADPYPLSPRPPSSSSFSFFLPSRTPLPLLALLALLLLVGVLLPWPLFSPSSLLGPAAGNPNPPLSRWRDYTLADAAAAVARNGTLILCAPRPPGPRHQALVVAEDYATLYAVNERWPGHAVLVPPAPDSQSAHKFGSQGFFNFTSRRPRHLLQILELGYSVMYNDVDMVWLADPFRYLEGNHDVYFTDDMAAVKPLNHPHDLPPPGKKGRTYICSCMIFLRPTEGAKKVMNKWIEELREQPWSKKTKSNDQPAFNWALNKTASQVDLYLLPQAAFPSGGLYFKNETWVKETKGMHVIIHNNYITGFEKKIKRFRDFGLWFVDKHSEESPLGRL
uniref:Glycosyltransferase n=1 Tax=Ananas comosus var. bracteatus TaxID=296719 RepID=A0A6V7PRY5_ANACO|nr:unnamed protein product [Ananas comosus var. bracteatus]